MSHPTVVAMAACAAAFSASSFGAVVVESELNGTATNNGTGTAQFLDQSAFTVGLGGEIEGMLPTASLRGQTGADDVDFFRFTTLGGLAHFDIDRTGMGVDTALALFRWDGTLIAECDDASGDAGSEGDWDAFIGDVSLQAGTYFIAVSSAGNSPAASFTGSMFTELMRPDGGYGGFLLADADMGDSSYLRSGEQDGQAYTLHVSIPAPSVLGVAAAGGFLLGRRRR